MLAPSAELERLTGSPPSCVRQVSSRYTSGGETPSSASSVLRVPQPQVLRRRLVDEPNPILAVDHHDALAQVLHDVLRELGDVAQVDPALLGERLALAQPVRDGHERRDHEESGAQDARGRVVRGRRVCPGTAKICWMPAPSVATAASRNGVALSSTSASVPTDTTRDSARPLDDPPLAWIRSAMHASRRPNCK